MSQVALSFGRGYPPLAPFDPADSFPELSFAGNHRRASGDNCVYRAVRETMALLGLDQAHFNTPHWNPLGRYVHRGDKVVIKPNLVLHEFGVQQNAHCLTTHGSVIRAVLDYVYLAAGPEGRIVIADAPLQGADFKEIVEQNGLRKIQQCYRNAVGVDIEIVDLRQQHAVIDEKASLIRRVEPLPGDPRGYCDIDLGEQSRLQELHGRCRYVVGDYDSAATNARHCNARHSYVVSRTVLEADSVICVPKLKTHCKAGITVCLKNMVGIIGSKDCLPHHRQGKVNHGGDEFPSNYPAPWLWSTRAYSFLQGRVPLPLWRGLRTCARALLGAGTPIDGKRRSRFFGPGAWRGNDTIWRTVDDLNRILFFYSMPKNSLQPQRQRRYFAFVDGIVGMEGNGPLRGSPKPAGVILAGDDPLVIDVVAAALMGFDWRQIRMLHGIADSKQLRYSAFDGSDSGLTIRSSVPGWNSLPAIAAEHLDFRAANGWREFVELARVA